MRTRLIVLILLCLVTTFVLAVCAPSLFSIEYVTVRKVALESGMGVYEVSITNCSLEPMQIDGILATCHCVERPRVPINIGVMGTSRIGLKADHKKQTGQVVLGFVPRPPHRQFYVRISI